MKKCNNCDYQIEEDEFEEKICPICNSDLEEKWE